MKRTILAVLLCTSFGASAEGVLPRLTVHPDGHYLMTEDGQPFFWLGDTAWELFHRLNREEAVRYLDNRAKLGFTVVQAVAIAELDGVGVPNAYGHLPFDFAKGPKEPEPIVKDGPDDDYWDHVDFIVREANARGIVVAMLPTWGRWWKESAVFTAESGRRYCTWLARRYRDAGIVWVLGGDRWVDAPEERAIIDAMAAGLREGDGGAHLMTFHPRGGGTSSKCLPNCDWIDFHMRQNGHGIDYPADPQERYAGTLAEARRTPAKPVLDGEPVYEGHPVAFKPDLYGHTVAADIRRAFFWDLFNGAFGHTYGHHSIWQMYDRGRRGVNRPLMTWKEALDEPGSRQIGLAKRLFLSRPFFTRVPAPEIIVPSDPASLVPGTGTRRFVATRDREGAFAMVYAPVGRRFKVDLSCIRSPRCRVAWYDPRTGEERDVRFIESAGVHEFIPPSEGELLDWVLLADATGDGMAGPHPRLFADEARLAELRTFCGRSPRGKAYRERLLADAERLMDVKPVERIVTGRRLLDVSREALARISCLAFAAQLTGERKYAERGVTELKASCGFSDWHTEHYLDTGELALAAAIGYDWLFDEMDAETRRRCARAIAVRSLETWNERHWWAKSDSNWNAVCNAGTLAACWALWDDPAEGTLARKVFVAARKSVVNGFGCYAPTGAYPEGPMYWGYGTAFACIAAEVVCEATGSDELFASKGFDRTCAYLGHVTAPSGGCFNFGDGQLRIRPEFPSFYLAWRFGRPETLSAFGPDLVSAQGRDRLFPLTGLYIDQEVPPASRRTVPEFWFSGESEVPCCSAALPNGAWFAVRGGKAASSHMHMDVGGFVYEAKGRRFVIDYGMEPYHNAESRGIPIWDGKRGGGRWNCFRLGPEAHAILRINGEMQDVDGFAPFTALETNDLPYRATLDLSALYPKARRVTRTFTLEADGRLVIRDLAEGLVEGDRVSVQYPLAKGSYRMAASAASAEDVLTLVCAGAEASVSDQQTRLAGWELPIQPSDRVDFTKRADKNGRVELVTELIPPR